MIPAMAEKEVRVGMGNPFGERGFSLRGASTLGFGVTDENVRAQTRSFCEGDPSAQKGSRRQTVDQNAFPRVHWDAARPHLQLKGAVSRA